MERNAVTATIDLFLFFVLFFSNFQINLFVKTEHDRGLCEAAGVSALSGFEKGFC